MLTRIAGLVAAAVLAVLPAGASAEDGALDTSFGSGGFALTTPRGSAIGFAEFRSVLVMPDGRYVAAGSVTNGSQMSYVIARYNANGTLDSSFGSGGVTVTTFPQPGRDEAVGLVRLSDGDLVVAGTIVGPQRGTTFPGSDFGDTDNFVALAGYFGSGPQAGQLDPSFGSNGLAVDQELVNAFRTATNANAVAVTNGNSQEILVAGRSNLAGQNPSMMLVRYDVTGRRVSEEELGLLPSVVNAVAVNPDNTIVLGGYSDGFGNGTRDIFQLDLVRPDGTQIGTDSAGEADFTSSQGARLLAVARTADGGYIGAGDARFSASRSDDRIALAKWTQAGTLDTHFGSGGKLLDPLNGDARAVFVQADGKFVVAGTAFAAGRSYPALIRYLPTGVRDPSFGGDGVVLAQSPDGVAGDGNALVAQAGGRFTVAGGNISPGSGRRLLLTRIGPPVLPGPCGSVLGCGALQPVTTGPASAPIITSLIVRPELTPCTVLQRCAGVGILVRRIVRTIHRRGNVSYVTRRIGRVPFGIQRPGTGAIRWNLRVDGKRLPPGRYIINIRALRGDRVVEVSTGFVLRLRARRG